MDWSVYDLDAWDGRDGRGMNKYKRKWWKTGEVMN